MTTMTERATDTCLDCGLPYEDGCRCPCTECGRLFAECRCDDSVFVDEDAGNDRPFELDEG